MTAPRQILPGTTYLVTRRCSERRFFLRPSTATTEIFQYVLAVAAARYGVLVHAFCVMSSHYHLVVTDSAALLPAFMRDLDSLVARATNAAIGHWEGFWSSEGSYSAVAHGSTDDVVRKIVYVLTNPVTAGLVPHGREWPGLWSAPEALGTGRFVVRRPEGFFRENGEMPATAELVLTLPPGFASAEELRRLVGDTVRDRETQIHREFQAERRSFVGRARVLAQSPFARPAGGEARRTLKPRVAARDEGERVGMIETFRDFLRAYRDAFASMRDGLRDVVFPAGTYRLRIEQGVRCAAFG